MRSYYSLFFCCVLLVGCSTGGAGTVPATANANGVLRPHAASRSEASFGRTVVRNASDCNVIYQFGGEPDGSVPLAGLTDVKSAARAISAPFTPSAPRVRRKYSTALRDRRTARPRWRA